MAKKYNTLALPFGPSVCVNFRETLLAPVFWVCFIRCKAVAIDEASAFLEYKTETLRK